MSPNTLTFRWTLGLSVLAHAVAYGSIWGSMGQSEAPQPLRRARDVWVGTTVSVIEATARPSVPERLENSPEGEAAAASDPSAGRTKRRRAEVAHNEPPKVINRTLSQRRDPAGDTKDCEAKLSSEGPVATPVASASGPGAAVDLKQAMRNSLTQPATEGGIFGAAGVDLSERRLPRALTRALPVAIGAEPAWWTHRTGSLGIVRFQVVLDESGKIQEVTIEDELKHPFQAHVLRRVVKLLSLGTFALPTATTGSAELNFEMRMLVEQQPPDTNSTADPGDVVEKGYEAPSLEKPGKAIIRDAPGHTVRAYLKLLPQRNAKVVGGELPAVAP